MRPFQVYFCLQVCAAHGELDGIKEDIHLYLQQLDMKADEKFSFVKNAFRERRSYFHVPGFRNLVSRIRSYDGTATWICSGRSALKSDHFENDATRAI